MKRTLILLSTLLGAACAPTLPRYQPLVMAELGEKLGGCDVGDLVPGGGDEVAVVSVSGALRVLEANGDAWSVIDAGRASGEMIQVAVGDVWPERGGDELIAVGMLAGDEESGGEGAVVVSGFDESTGDFSARPVFTDSALVHAVAVCDLDPAVEGDEALVGGFSDALTLLRFHGDGQVTSEEIGRTPAAAKGMVPHGDGVAVACRDGSLLVVRPSDEGFVTEVLFRAPSGLARLASSGEEILAASDDGTLWLVQRREGTRLFRDSLKLRGAVFTDLDSASPGLEVATAGYSGRVSLLHETAGEWTAETVIATEAALHHLTSGELDRATGQELVTVGFAGDVVLLRRAR